MNNQLFLVIAILFIVMIIIDFVFNFTGILKENFDVFSNDTYIEAINNSNNNNYNNINNNQISETDSTLTNKVYTVISHSTGSIYGVIPLGNRLPTRKCVFLVRNNIALSIDTEGRINRKLANKFDETQHFRLVKISNREDLENTIINNVYTIPEEEQYPYYFLQSVKNPNYVISQLSEGEITLEQISNSLAQRFDISHEELLSVLSEEDENPKALKIKLKLDDNSLNKILEELRTIGFDTNDNDTNFHDFNNFPDISANDMDGNYADENCDIENYLPREALSSLCYNCEV
jgi:hypothetical protein